MVEQDKEMTPEQRDALRLQYQEALLNFRSTWDLYLKFYVAFMALNFTALGLTIQYVHRDNRMLLVWSFALQNLMSACTALGVGGYSRKVQATQQSILTLLGGWASSATAPTTSVTIPGRLGFRSGAINAVGHVLFIVCWIAAARAP